MAALTSIKASQGGLLSLLGNSTDMTMTEPRLLLSFLHSHCGPHFGWITPTYPGKFPTGSHPLFWWILGEILSGEFPKATLVESISPTGQMIFTRSKITIFFFVPSTLELWQHVTMLNSQHGNSERWFLHLVSPTHHTNPKGWMELMSCGWGGEIFTAVLTCILHKPNHTCSPACTSQRDPHHSLGCTWSVHEADILAGGGVIPTPVLTCFRYAHAHFAAY